MHFCICYIYIGNDNREPSSTNDQSALTVAEMATAASKHTPSNDSSRLDLLKCSRHISSASLFDLEQVNINMKIVNHLVDETYL